MLSLICKIKKKLIQTTLQFKKGKNLKRRNNTNELIYKTEINSHTKKQIYGYQREKMGKDKLGVWG